MDQPVVVTVGFAADERGGGVAYTALRGKGVREEAFVRVCFACRPLPALLGRDVTYSALIAVVDTLLARGMRNVRIRVEDARIAEDLSERRILPKALTVPYVALRCKLNRFVTATVRPVADALTRDLTARARAEALLHVAA